MGDVLFFLAWRGKSNWTWPRPAKEGRGEAREHRRGGRRTGRGGGGRRELN